MPVIIKQIKSQVEYERLYNEASTEAVEKKLHLLKQRLNKMFDLFIDGKIDEEMYNNKRIEFETEIDELNARLNLLNKQPAEVIKFSENLLELFKNARGKYLAASFEYKKELINLVCSNFYYDGENLTVAIKKAFLPIVKIASFRNGGAKEAKLELLTKNYLESLKTIDLQTYIIKVDEILGTVKAA